MTFFRSFLVLSFLFTTPLFAGIVSFDDHQLLIDGKAQPQLFGAELQYFRLRGGYGKNIPRAKVIELWNKALDRMVEAKMNTVSFYIPWDFHEYAEGKFDFDGTVDEDGDGNADYPSRDIFTFFRLIEEHGIHKIMARPGPYINAEWGFLGFGAVPKWFHDKFPDSHMRNQLGLRTKLYDYHNADLLKYSERWFKVVYDRVLKSRIGAGKPISFLQLDNETNFMWQSIFNHDHGPNARLRYQKFLEKNYGSIDQLNRQHNRSWKKWSDITTPKISGVNVPEDQDWYRFQDHSMYEYLKLVRAMWEKIGVHEPDVLFTLAESYNAMKDGILPHYEYRNDPGKTGMMTVNLYPKTYDLPGRPLLNLPFKSDHDVKSADAATDYYLGQNVEWVFGPEIQGGWWKGIDVSPEARRQTYLTTIGHGLKALMVYYFHEGDNWQVGGLFEALSPMLEKLKEKRSLQSLRVEELPENFWNDFQKQVDTEYLSGIDVRTVMKTKLNQDRDLFFDAPLDGNADPRKHFEDLKDIGVKLIGPYQDFLGRATAMTDDVCLIRENSQHAPSQSANIDSLVMNGEWMGGLLGYLLQNGVNPRFHHWGMNPETELHSCAVLIRQDNGPVNPKLVTKLKSLLEEGKTVLNFVDSNLTRSLGLNLQQKSGLSRGEWVSFLHDNTHSLFSATPYFFYNVANERACKNVMYYNQESVSIECQVGKGTLVQTGAVFYGVFNTDWYAEQKDVAQKSQFINYYLRNKIKTHLSLRGEPDRIAIFGRTDGKMNWITVKSSRKESATATIILNLIDSSKNYIVKDLMTGKTSKSAGANLRSNGIPVELGSYGSTVITVNAE
ncbi:MAG: beta-galactosidase [Bdellovibrionota bacterium]